MHTQRNIASGVAQYDYVFATFRSALMYMWAHNCSTTRAADWLGS